MTIIVIATVNDENGINLMIFLNQSIHLPINCVLCRKLDSISIHLPYSNSTYTPGFEICTGKSFIKYV